MTLLFLQVDSVVDIFARKLRDKGPATLLAQIPSPAESEVIRWTVGEKNKSVLLFEFDRNRYIFRIPFFYSHPDSDVTAHNEKKL